jgi:hypothetical protein
MRRDWMVAGLRVRTKQTLQRRAAVLRELDQSGLSMAEYCRQRGLVYGTVAAWRSVARRNRPAFVEVEAHGDELSAVASQSAAKLWAELLLPGGAVLRVFGHDDAAQTGERV